MSGTQLLDRAVILLDVVASGDGGGVALKDIAARTGLNAATCHRILSRLVEHGMLDRVEGEKRYVLGLRLSVLGARAARGGGLRTACQAALRRLREATAQTAVLMVRSGAMCVCVDRVDGDFSFRTLTGSIGGAVPMGVGNGSVAILATLDQASIAAILDVNEAHFGDFPGVDRTVVARRIAAARADDASIDRGELIDGVGGVAVPLRTGSGAAFASIGLTFLATAANASRIDAFQALLAAEAAGLVPHLAGHDPQTTMGI